MRYKFIFLIASVLLVAVSRSQQQKVYTRADTLRGSITKERAWWDVLRYDLTIKPDYTNKSTLGKNSITYKVTSTQNASVLQLDLQEPLAIDSIVLNAKARLSFKKDGNTWQVKM